MSSNRAARHFDTEGLTSVRDIPRTAGLPGVDTDASSSVKHVGFIFFADGFRNGINTRSFILRELARRDLSSTTHLRANPSSKDGAADRSQGKGGR